VRGGYPVDTHPIVSRSPRSAASIAAASHPRVELVPRARAAPRHYLTGAAGIWHLHPATGQSLHLHLASRNQLDVTIIGDHGGDRPVSTEPQPPAHPPSRARHEARRPQCAVIYQFRVEVGTRPDGSREWQWFTFATLAAARKELRRIATEVVAGHLRVRRLRTTEPFLRPDLPRAVVLACCWSAGSGMVQASMSDSCDGN
jgi:hypothetical protein